MQLNITERSKGKLKYFTWIMSKIEDYLKSLNDAILYILILTITKGHVCLNNKYTNTDSDLTSSATLSRFNIV